MPYRAMKRCGEPGCKAKVHWRDYYCAVHQKKAQRDVDKRRGSSTERGYDAKWRKIRDNYMRENPLCEDCRDQRITRVADLVHHIVPLDEGGDKYAFSNLKSLCTKCHNRIHGWGKDA